MTRCDNKCVKHRVQMVFLIVVPVILSCLSLLPAQEIKTHHQHQIIVQLKAEAGAPEFVSSLDSSRYRIRKTLVRRLKIYLLEILDPRITPREALLDLRLNSSVQAAQLDHIAKSRGTFPDDPQFSDQWALHNVGQSGGTVDADIDAPEAWDLSEGGVTPLGDTIVVAIVDNGCMVTHPDLAANIWRNWGEIGGNRIDDDANGYVDDQHGWNAINSSGQIPFGNHGTHIAGILGARGNNGTQVTGVNWNVKIMPVVGMSDSTSTILEAYGYILDQRVLYDSTQGDKGAFVVAVNSSFGIDYADCSSGEYPLWNALFDALGEVGILNVAATMNNNADVDSSGDVPTGCDSDYLLSVTSTTRSDGKYATAAYGLTTIDLGAPGDNILSTTTTGSGTQGLSGTSRAAPFVAGAVGLLHAAMSQEFADYYRDDPAQGALMLKAILLNTADPIPDLDGRSVSGGRLNLYSAAREARYRLVSAPMDPNPVTDLQADTSQWYQAELTWKDPVTLYGGGLITETFVIDVYRDGVRIESVDQGIEAYVDGPLPGGVTYLYEIITRLESSGLTSIPTEVLVTINGEACLPGDINGDENVDVTDIIRLLRLILGEDEITDSHRCTGDMDRDGDLSIFDVLLIGDLILGPG